MGALMIVEFPLLTTADSEPGDEAHRWMRTWKGERSLSLIFRVLTYFTIEGPSPMPLSAN